MTNKEIRPVVEELLWHAPRDRQALLRHIRRRLGFRMPVLFCLIVFYTVPESSHCTKGKWELPFSEEQGRVKHKNSWMRVNHKSTALNLIIRKSTESAVLEERHCDLHLKSFDLPHCLCCRVGGCYKSYSVATKTVDLNLRLGVICSHEYQYNAGLQKLLTSIKRTIQTSKLLRSLNLKN